MSVLETAKNVITSPILGPAQNLARNFSNIEKDKEEFSLEGPTETSETVAQQRSLLDKNFEIEVNDPIISSTDWYAKLKYTNLVPQQKSYYFDNTKQIVNSLGIQGISDYDINTYLDNNDLEGLDKLVLGKYTETYQRDQADLYGNILSAPDLTAAQKADRLKQIKLEEEKTSLKLEDIIALRSKVTSEILKNKEKDLSKQTSYRNDILEDTAYKTNRIAQLIQKNFKAREARGYLDAFGDITERSLPGVRFHQTAMQNLLLQNLDVRNPEESFIKNLVDSVFTGSSWEEVADNIWDLPKDKFDAVMNLIEKHPLFSDNLFTQAEVLGALVGTSGLTTGITNALDVVNTIGTANLVKTAFSKGAIKPEVIPPQGQLEAPVIIDVDFTEIRSGVSTKVSPRAIVPFESFKNALVKVEVPLEGRFRQVVGYEYLKDGDFIIKYKYFNSVKDLWEAFKENPNAIIQSVPETDKTPAGKVRKVPAYNDIYAKGYQNIDPNTFFNSSKKASTRAYTEGSTIEGDLNAGARDTASSKLNEKINNFKKGKGERPTQEDIFIAEPEIISGAPRKTTANAKILQEPTLEIPTNEQLRNVGPYLTIGDLDPKAAESMIAKANETLFRTTEYLKSQPIDLKVANTSTVTELGGVITKEIYGVGSKGNTPLDLSFLEAQELTEGGPFTVIQDTNGDVWLTRDMYIPYNSGIASPIEGVTPGVSTRFWSAGTTGVDEEIANQLYQAVGYRAGWKDSLTQMVKKINKGVSKGEKELAESIFQEESITGNRLSDEELLARSGTLTNVYQYVKDLREFEKLGISAVNNFERQAAIAEGFHGLVLDKNPFNFETDSIANSFSSPLIAKKVEDVTLGDLRKDFVAYTKNGAIIPPETDFPFELENVDVYKLQHSLYNNKYDKVNYVVAPKGDPNVHITAVPQRVIGDQPHAGWRYKDPWFIRFDRLTKDSAGRPFGYSKTVATASSIKQAKEIVKKFQEISKAIVNYDAGLIGEREANRLIQQIALSGKYPLAPELQTLQGFKDYLDYRHMTDLPTNGNAYKLTIDRDLFTPDSTIQLDDGETIAGNNLGSRYKVGSSPLLNPTYSSKIPKRVDTTQYLGDLINRTSSLIGVMPTYEVMARRFAATYGNLVNREVPGYSDIAFLRDPDRFIRPELQTTKDPLYAQAKTFSRMVNMALDQTQQETLWNSWVNETVNNLVKSEFPGFNSLGDVLNNHHDPLKLLNAFLYSTTFALRPAQLITQTFLTTIMTGVLSPIKTTKALGALYPVLHAMNVLRKGTNVESSMQALAKWPAILQFWPGFTAEDLKALATECRNLGYGELSFNDVRNNGVMSKTHNWAYWPFDKGNQFSRLIGTIVAAEQRSTKVKKPIAKFNSGDWAWVAKTSDAFSGGSSRANKRAFTELPVIKQLAMMNSFTLNTFESFFGSKLNLTKSQKAMWFGAMMLLFGLDMFLDSEDSEKYGLNFENLTGVDFRTVAHGFLGNAMKSLFGYEVDLGTNAPRLLGNIYAEILNAFRDLDNVDYKPYIASTLGRVWGSAKNAYLAIQKPLVYDENGNKYPTTADRLVDVGLSIARIWTGLADAEQLITATAWNEWRNREGIDLLSFDAVREDLPYKAKVKYLLGFKPLVESGTRDYAVTSYIKDSKADTAKLITLAKKQWMNAYKALANEKRDPESIKQIFKEAQSITCLAVSGKTQAQQEEILNSIYSFYNDLDKATVTYLSKKENPWVTDDEALSKWIEESKMQIKGATLLVPSEPEETERSSGIGVYRNNRLQLVE